MFRKLAKRFRQGHSPAVNRSKRLRLFEQLEDRRLLAVTVINDTFDTQKSADVLNFRGTARYAGNNSNGYITLVTASPDQLGSVYLDSHLERAVDFNLVSNYSIKQGNEADGISFGYGSLTGNAFGERGEATNRNGLWVVLDTFRGSAGNAMLEVWYNGCQPN